MDKFLRSRMFLNVNNVIKSASSPSLFWRSSKLGKRDSVSKSVVTSCIPVDRDRPTRPSSNICNFDCSKEWRHFRREVHALYRILDKSGLVTQSQILHAGPAWNARQHYSTSSDQDPKKGGSWGNKPPNMGFLFTMLMFTVFFALSSLFFVSKATEMRQITWENFCADILMKGEVESIEIPKPSSGDSGEVIVIRVHGGARVNGVLVPKRLIMKTPTKGWFEQRLHDKEDELNVAMPERIRVNHTDVLDPVSTKNLGILWLSVLIWLMLAIRFRKLLNTKKAGDAMKNKPKEKSSSTNFDIMNPFKMKITRGDEVNNPRFKDVAGLREAKVEIQEFVDYLKTPQRFKDIGAKIPRGALLLGPPGCGKTFIAKALAGESEVPFLALSGTDFIQMIGGLGAKRVRDLFKEARSCAPCIVYIDEIDTIGKKRGPSSSSSSQEFDQTLNQLLTEMDGMQTTEGVIVLASTNRSQTLDEALLRPGRLDRHILIDLPTLTERIELYELYLAKLTLGVPISLLAPKLAQLTPGMSGADIANICNEAAIHAARELKKEVVEADLFYAVDRVLEGPEKKSKILTADTRKIVAFHEGGHTLVGWMLQTPDAIAKVSIVPRAGKNALGFTRQFRSEHIFYSKEYLFEQMCVLLGGRAAEAITFNRVTHGAEDDLNKVTEFAYRMVKEFGMSEKVGPISFKEEGGFEPRPYSEYLQNIIDLEAKELITKAYRQTEEILNNNKGKLKLLSEALLEKETLNYSEIEKILGPPPHGTKSAGIAQDLSYS